VTFDRLLLEFESLFRGAIFRHRVSTNGDRVAGFLYDDLFDLNRSPKLVAGIAAHRLVLNKKNRTTGRTARRGDGTFGERVPAVPPQIRPGLAVALGDVATIEIGAEAKILAKAMIKQIDRVCTDMRNQADEFRRHNPTAICVGLVGINHAASYIGYEGAKLWPTDGRTYAHPVQEAAEAEIRIQKYVTPKFDETIILRFIAENAPPYSFAWVDAAKTAAEYSAALVRISREYERRF
jgi:hypothetical protein